MSLYRSSRYFAYFSSSSKYRYILLYKVYLNRKKTKLQYIIYIITEINVTSLCVQFAFIYLRAHVEFYISTPKLRRTNSSVILPRTSRVPYT